MSRIPCPHCGEWATIKEGKITCKYCGTDHTHQSVEEKVKCTKCVKEDYPKGVKS